MKPAPFAYHRPATVDEALRLLAELGDEAKVLAGGQSLVPTMSFRLAQPAVLVDLNAIDTLRYVRKADDGGLAIGAMTRQRTVERHPEVARRAPLVAETIPFIAHPQIRNRGTFGGSIAHADPASELPAVLTALGGRCTLRSERGARTLAADDFFVGLLETALRPDELLTEIALPPLPARTGWAFDEIARRSGDYALVGVASTVTLDTRGTVEEARLVFLSVGEGPTHAHEACRVLRGTRLDEASIRTACNTLTTDLDPPDDIHATATYRHHLASVLTSRVLRRAAARAADRD